MKPSNDNEGSGYKGAILWVDNDDVPLGPHMLRLKLAKYSVQQVTSFTETLDKLRGGDYDLLILDAMMPITVNEDAVLHDKDTDKGRQAGLVFYNEYKELLDEKRVKVLVFTIREDNDIRNQFKEAGLPEKNFMTKVEGADTAVFLIRVEEILRGAQSREDNT